jgi:hypothetical protein
MKYRGKLQLLVFLHPAADPMRKIPVVIPSASIAVPSPFFNVLSQDRSRLIDVLIFDRIFIALAFTYSGPI